jgi:hypothetical protein
MVFDIKPMVFPPGDVGGEFVCKVLVAGLLSQLDAGTPYNGWILGGGLWFDPEEKAEKIPVGFDSKEGFTEMDKNRDMANRVRVEDAAQARNSKGGHGKKNKRGGPAPVRQNDKM